MTPSERRFPWWTWIVPFGVSFLGAGVPFALRGDVKNVTASWALALGLIAALWWGPRAFAGLYLGAALAFGVWGGARGLEPFVYALPVTAAAAVGWWVLTRPHRRSPGLPTIHNVLLFDLTSLGLTAAVNTLGLAFLKMALRGISMNQALQGWQYAYLGAALDMLSLTVPLLTFLNPVLDRRSWLVPGNLKPVGAVDRKATWLESLELGVILCGLALAGLIFPVDRTWLLFCVLTIWGTLRFGYGLAAVSVALLLFEGVYLPSFLPRVFPLAGLMTLGQAYTTQRVALVLSVAVLVTGRVLDDLSKEMRHRAEGERALKTHRDIVETMQSGLIVLQLEDPRDDGSLRLSIANPTASSMLGLDFEHNSGRRIVDFFAPGGTAGGLLQAYLSTMAATARGEAQPQEYPDLRYIRPNGETAYFSLKVFPLPERSVGLLLEDTTARKEARIFLEKQGAFQDALSNVHEMDVGLALCLKTAVDLSGMDAGGIYLYNSENNLLVLFRHMGISSAFASSVRSISPSHVIVKAMRKNELLMLENFDKVSPLSYADSQEGLRAVAVMPIFSLGNPLGCLLVASHRMSSVPEGSRRALETVAGLTGSWIVRVRAEEALADREQRFRAMIENSAEVISILGRDGRVTYISPAVEKVRGYKPDEVVSQRTFSGVHPDDVGLINTAFREISEFPGIKRAVQIRVNHKDGRWIWVDVVGQNFFDDPVINGIVVNYHDVSEEHAAAEQLRASLDEKNVLLREVHHRVKNNMQVMISLLDLQALRISDAEVRERFLESENRIRSMAMIHEQLYQSTSLARIEFDVYLDRLAKDLHNAYAHSERVLLALSLQPVELEVDTAIPCGLIVNELVTNALKHAFPDGRGGTVSVSLAARDGQVQVAVADDGVGLPPGLDPARLDSMGMKLVSLLTRQIDGALTQENGRGTRFTLCFPAARER